jgi:uncharacterized delta-60 repeat protein
VPGDLDATFNPGTGANARVLSLARQSDGKLIVGGEFTSFNGQARGCLVRLNADGSTDAGFATASGTGAGAPVNDVALAPDGKIVIAGSFYSCNGTNRTRVARLNADGSLDLTFAPTGTPDGVVQTVAVQADGKVLIAGGFSTVSGTARPRVARLNTDGSLDSTFDPGTGPNAYVQNVVVQGDGKVLIGGYFSAVNGATRHRIARLNADGSVDASFFPATLDNGSITGVSITGDGKVLVAGSLYIGLKNRVLRLNGDGSRDTTFNTGNNLINADALTAVAQADGKVLIGGYFSAVSGQSRNGVARLNANGTLDTGFNPGTGANNTVWALLLDADGSVVVGGSFTTYAGVARNRIARLQNLSLNKPPVMAAVPLQALMEGTPVSPALLTGIAPGPASDAAQMVTNLTATSSNPALVPHPTVSFTPGATTASLAFTLLPNATGTVTITVVLQDNGGTDGGGVDRSTNTFTVSVNVNNAAPSFALSTASVTALEDAGARTFPGVATNIQPGAADEAGQTVSFLVTSDNASLFSVAPAISTNGTLTFTPATNAVGTALISVRAQDNGGTANGGVDTSAPQTFTITVTPVNDAPQIGFASNVVVLEDSVLFAPAASQTEVLPSASPGVPVVNAFTVSAYPASPGQSLTFTAAATDPEGQAIQYSFNFGDGTASTAFGATATATHSYAADGHYAATVQARDPGGLVATRTLTVTVLSGSMSGLGAPRSGPIALHPTSREVWVVNPDNNTVQTLHADTLVRGTERTVGAEPRNVAFDSAGNAWVTCHKGDRIDVLGASALSLPVRYGSAPFGIVISPDGATAYVSMFGSGEIVRFDTATRTATGTLAVGPTPRALALNADGSRLYVTRFISARGHAEVWEVDTASLTLLRTLRIAKLGGAAHRDSPNEGKGVPNYLAGLTFSRDGTRLLVAANKPNTDKGAATGADLDEENAVRNLVVILDVTSGAVVRAIDMDNSDSASALALSPLGDYFFTTQQGNNDLAIFDALQAESAAGSGGRVARRAVGGAPQGIVVDAVTRRAFVQNLTSRTVTVLELDEFLRTGAVSIPATNFTTAAVELVLPQVKRGKEIFYNASDRRMSVEGYISCASCHVDGAQDGRVWDFSGRGEGLRNTITLHGRSGTAHGNVHWSANFDEIQDFEHDVRGAFGGTGFLTAAQFAAANTSLGLPKAGLNADLDALAAYVSSLGNETLPRSPTRAADGSLTSAAQAGAAVFAAQNCASCHTGSTMRDGQLHNVGTLRPTSGQRLGGPLTGIDTPTLRGVWSTAPYFHDGSAATLEDVFRVAGGALYPAELTVLAGSTQVVSNDVNYVLNYDETAFGKAFVIVGNGATVTFATVNGGAGGLGAIEVRYGTGNGPAPLIMRVNGTTYSATLPQAFNDPPERRVNWLTYRFEDVPLLAGANNTIVLEAGAVELLVDHIVVSTPDDFVLAEPHRRVLALTAGDRDNLLAYVRELDGSPLPDQQDATFITVPPVSAVAIVGADHTFHAAAIGTAPLSFQWLRDNVPLVGANGSSLTLTGVTSAHNGSYAVQVSGPGGNATSRAATLQVNEPPAPHPGLGFASATSYGAANEAGQSITNYTVANSRPALFSTQPAIAADGQLTFIPAANAIGTATVTVVAQDNGGTANGGLNRTTNTFTITVNPVNDAPSFSLNASLLGGGRAMPNTSLIVWGKDNVHQSSIPAGLTGVTSIEAGWYHSLAIRSDGKLFAWGWNDDGQSTVPAGLTGVMAAAGGWTHSLALLSNGTMVAWGKNDFGQTNIPAGLSGVTAIAASEAYNLALKSDGTVVGWGRNDFGQRNIPAGLSGVTAISAGQRHGLALKSDGTVVAWGDNSWGQRTVPAGLSGVIAIDAGREFNLALKADGTVVAWGYNGFGQTAVPAGLSGVTAIAAGDHYSMVLKRDGTIQAWGENQNGQVTIPAGLRGVIAIGAGGFHNVVLYATDGSVSANPLTVLEDSGPQTVSLMVTNIVAGPADEVGQAVSLLFTNDNPALFSAQPSIAANGTLTFTPAANAFGNAVVTVRARDNGGTANGGVDTSAPQTFTITVSPVNESPSISFASNVVVSEDIGGFTASGFVSVTSFGPGNESTESIANYTVSNNNPALFSVPPAIAVNGTLTFTPAADASGVATITVIARDNGGTANGGVDATIGTFTITVTSVNDAPMFTLSRMLITVAASSGATSLPVIASASAGPVSEAAQTLSYVTANSSSNLFTVQPTVSAAGNLSFTVAPGQNGAATVTIRARDTGGTANGGVDTSAPQTLVIAVGAQNAAPSFSLAGGTVTVAEDAGPQTRTGFLSSLSPGSGTETTQTVTVVVSHTFPALFSAPPIIDGAGGLTFTPAPNASGSSTVTVTATDNGVPVASVQQTFTIMVTTVNDAPVVVLPFADFTVSEDAANVVTNLATLFSDVETPVTSLVYAVAFNTNTALVTATITSGTNLTLHFAANANGMSQIAVSATDAGGLAVTNSFVVTVLPVNDAPSFTKGADQLVYPGDGPVSVANWATGLSVGPADEVLAGQTLAFTMVNGNHALFTDQPALSPSGTLTYTPAVGAVGVVTVTVSAQDSGGTSPGVDTSAGQTFTITLASAKVFVSAVPSVVAGATVEVPVSLAADGTASAVAFTLTFDPAVLTFASVAADSGLTLFPNSTGAASGQLGLVVSQPPVAAFPAGTNLLLTVTFTAASGAAAGTTPIGFSSAVATRQVTEADADVIPYVLYTGGNVSISALPAGMEGDVTPRPTGNGSVTVSDAVQIGNFVSGLATITNFGVGGEFQRADCAPLGTKGDGYITVADWVQTMRFANGLDTPSTPGGPTMQGASLRPEALLATSGRTLRVVGGNLVAGRANTVSVQLDAQGNEAGVQFSLGFDPGVLTFVSAAAGSGAPGATVAANAQRASGGRVGLVLVMPAGISLAAGTRDLITLTFTVIGTGNTAVSVLNDTAASPREVADVNANPVGASYVGGSFNVILPVGLKAIGMERAPDGLPRLVMRNSDGTPVTTAQSAKYGVYVTSNLGGTWTLLPNALVLEAGALKIVDPAASGAGLRLYKLVETP